jgi:hypothetical protein
MVGPCKGKGGVRWFFDKSASKAQTGEEFDTGEWFFFFIHGDTTRHDEGQSRKRMQRIAEDSRWSHETEKDDGIF